MPASVSQPVAPAAEGKRKPFLVHGAIVKGKAEGPFARLNPATGAAT